MDAVGALVIDSEELKRIISENGVSLTHLANNLGIQTRTLKEKIDGRSDFWWHEVIILKKILRLTDEEFSKIFGL